MIIPLAGCFVMQNFTKLVLAPQKFVDGS